jgi:hypothetical protein
MFRTVFRFSAFTILALISVAIFSASAPDSGPAMFRANPQHTGVYAEKAKLMAQLPGQPKVELRAESETRFFVNDSPAEFEFVKDASGQCTQVVLRQAGSEFTLKKLR